MSPTSVGSLWLPGFDPHPVVTVDTAEALVSVVEPATHPFEPQALSTADSGLIDSVTPRHWQPSGTPDAAPPRGLWPQLSRADLLTSHGAVAKFEANLAAIDALRQIEECDHVQTPAQRAALLRFTGWGGIPASFNLQ